MSATGNGVVVAVLDTGVDMFHSKLVNNIWTNSLEIAGDGIDNDGNGYIDDHNGWDFIANDNNASDEHGHGTHVAGIVAAANDGRGITGVAHGATIMPIRVLDAQGSGSWQQVAMGIYYAVDNGADIINMSLGGGYSRAIYDALAYAARAGVFVVAAAGNDGDNSPGYPAYFSEELNNVLSVGAFNSSGSLADFSNRVGRSGAVQVDAPGVAINSSVPGQGFASWQGTSMAAPHVAALALSVNRDMSASDLRDVIVQNATQRISGSDSVGGIQVGTTVQAAISSSQDINRGNSAFVAGAPMAQPMTGAIGIHSVPHDLVFSTVWATDDNEDESPVADELLNQLLALV